MNSHTSACASTTSRTRSVASACKGLMPTDRAISGATPTTATPRRPPPCPASTCTTAPAPSVARAHRRSATVDAQPTTAMMTKLARQIAGLSGAADLREQAHERGEQEGEVDRPHPAPHPRFAQPGGVLLDDGPPQPGQGEAGRREQGIERADVHGGLPFSSRCGRRTPATRRTARRTAARPGGSARDGPGRPWVTLRHEDVVELGVVEPGRGRLVPVGGEHDSVQP